MDEATLEFLLIGDSVENANGKLYGMGGGWMQFNSNQFPVAARFGIAVSILVSSKLPKERRQLPIHIICSNANMTLQLEANVEIDSPLAESLLDVRRIFVTLNMNLPIQSPGRYEIKARLDNGEEKTVQFEAILRTAQLN